MQPLPDGLMQGGLTWVRLALAIRERCTFPSQHVTVRNCLSKFGYFLH